MLVRFWSASIRAIIVCGATAGGATAGGVMNGEACAG